MLQSIQHLRGYAALVVTIFHLYPMFIVSGGNPLSAGAAGVDVFFVISGFIMWHVAQAKEPEPLNFLAHRFIRIAPPYWFVTLLLAACAIAKPNLFPLDHPTISHVLASMAFIPHGDGPEGTPLVTQGWTLNYEMFFYVMFAAMLLLEGRARLWAITLLLTALAAIGFVVRPESPIPSLLFSPLLLEFLAGIYIAVALERRMVLPRPAAFIAVAVAILLICLNIKALHFRAIYFGAPAALLVWAMVSIEASKPFAANAWNRAMMALGAASFSLYLVHFLAGNFVQIVGAAVGLPVHGPLPFTIGVALAIVAGSAFHFSVERYLTKALKPLVGSVNGLTTTPR